MEDGTPKLTLSVVAFIDILGYSEKMLAAEKEGKEQSFLIELHSVLSRAFSHLECDISEDNPLRSSGLLKKDLYKLKTFSDNIVIGYPIREDAESELGRIFSMLSFFQLEMVNSGFFIRGAISIGDFYADDRVVYGKALIDAYRAETQLSRDPRVILTDTSVKAVEKHITYYSNPKHSPQARDLYRDADGQVFINYLESIMITEQAYGPYTDELLKHKASVEKNLKKYLGNPRLWSKYSWVATYHNFFCEQYSYFNDEHRIDRGKYQMTPARIV